MQPTHRNPLKILATQLFTVFNASQNTRTTARYREREREKSFWWMRCLPLLSILCACAYVLAVLFFFFFLERSKKSVSFESSLEIEREWMLMHSLYPVLPLKAAWINISHWWYNVVKQNVGKTMAFIIQYTLLNSFGWNHHQLHEIYSVCGRITFLWSIVIDMLLSMLVDTFKTAT